MPVKSLKVSCGFWNTHPEDEKLRYDIEMAAAVLAVHVCDWHYVRGLGHARAADTDKQQFATAYPGWDILRKIANGTKHPEARNTDVSSAVTGEVEWKKLDFWHAPQGRPTLLIEVDGVERSVHSLTHGFCRQYLAATATPDEWEPWMRAYRRRSTRQAGKGGPKPPTVVTES
jgi:hypothetical protein